VPSNAKKILLKKKRVFKKNDFESAKNINKKADLKLKKGINFITMSEHSLVVTKTTNRLI